MFFRFGCAMVLVVLISLSGVALEKRNLQLRREVSRQHYRTDVLRDRYARLRLRTQQLGAPIQTIRALDSGTMPVRPPEQPAAASPHPMPLLRWQIR